MPIVAKCSKSRLLTVYRPFFTVFPADPIGDSLDETRVAPFSCDAARLENGENPRTADAIRGPEGPPVFSLI